MWCEMQLKKTNAKAAVSPRSPVVVVFCLSRGASKGLALPLLPSRSLALSLSPLLSLGTCQEKQVLPLTISKVSPFARSKVVLE